MPRYKLTVAYDGTDYCGWQRQEPPAPPPDARPADQQPSRPNPAKVEAGSITGEDGRERLVLRTVQHTLEQAVAAVVRQPVTLTGASRTDAGVHARGQVAAFTCAGDEESGAGWPLRRGCDRLLRALNGRLPDDVLVTACEPVSEDFDPIRGAERKGYSYLLHVSPPPPHGSGLRPMWDRRYVHHVWESLNVGAMQQAAAGLVGEHDFAGFAAAGHGRQTTVRRVISCTVASVEPPAGSGTGVSRVRIDVEGTGFLWNMVRIIAGTLVDVGRGRIDADRIGAILASRDRTQAGPTLPPTGLCLEWIAYE